MEEAPYSNIDSKENYKANNHPNELHLFHLLGGRKKIMVLLKDIVLIRSIKGGGHTDKLLYLKNNLVHKVRGHPLQEFMNLTGFLLRVNKQDLVSAYAINYVADDTIYLNYITDDGKPVFVTLTKTYKSHFFEFFNKGNALFDV